MEKEKSAREQVEAEKKQDEKAEDFDGEEIRRAIAEGIGEYRRRLLDARLRSGIFSRRSLMS